MKTQSPLKESKDSVLSLLQKSKKELLKVPQNQAQFAQTLQIIDSQLSHLNIDQLIPVQSLLYDICKPMTRQITNFNPNELPTVKLMKSVILKIFGLYANIFVKFQNVGSLQIIKELVLRQSYLFINTIHRASAAAGVASPGSVPSAINKANIFEDDSDQNEKQQNTYKYSKGRLGYTRFHKDCCQIVFEALYPLPQNFETMKLNTIKQLMSFMYFFEDYIYDGQMYKFSIRSYESLGKIASKPSKQHMKQATKQIFEQISQKMTRILHYHQDRQLKRQIMLIGPIFSINILENQQSIETKLFGLRILQKFAYQYFYRNNDLIKDEFFGQWLVEHQLWQTLVGKTVDWAMIHSSEYILKLIINKGKISIERFQQFLQLLWEVKQDIRRCYIKSIDALKLSFSFMNMVLTNFRKIRENADLYVEDFFYLVESLCRYGSDSQRRNCIDIMLSLIRAHYNNWKAHFQRKSIDSFKYCFQKLADGTKDLSERSQMYIDIINEFISEPNYLTLSISRSIFQSQQKKTSYAIQKAAKMLVEQRKIIEVIINLMSQKIAFKGELMYFLKAILMKYKNYNLSATLALPEKIMVQSTAYPEVFTELISFSHPQDCEKLMHKLLKTIYSDEISFQCVKQLFYKSNYAFIEVIEPEYFRRRQYRVKYNPNSLHFIDELSLLLVSCPFSQVQQKCAELLADLFTCFSQIYMEKGKIKSKQFMQQLVEKVQSFNVDQSSLSKVENKTQLYGLLCLVKQMLSATQIYGISDLKPHNSLITTSMIKVKIWNNSSYGDDVQKCYEKTVPSNMTLFELLTVIGQKFKCGQHELYLQEGSDLAIPPKMNGHTLLELGFSHFREFNAYKNHKIQIRKQSLKIDKQLNPKFLSIIRQIFTMFSQQGKMGEQQIVNYIQAVTASPSHSKDSRVQTLLREYDSDHDGYLTQADLIKFYQDSCEDAEKEKYIWNNLTNLHYRQDLRKFNQPIGPIQEDNLFRYHVKNSQQIYDLLFKLCKQKDSAISFLSKHILVRLPTCESFLSNFSESLNFQNKSTFEISYILINVRHFLEKQKQKQNSSQNITLKLKAQHETIQEKQSISQSQNKMHESNQIINFIQNKNDLKIFELIQKLSQKPQKTEEQKVLLIVSINILRTLLQFPSLSQNYIKNQKYQIQHLYSILSKVNPLNFNENTRFFIQMASKCFGQNQFAVYQSALALSLSQKTLKWESWMESGIFHSQFEVRKITLNFLLFYSLKSNFSIDFFNFNVQINPNRCEEWFLLLYFYIRYNKKLDISRILEATLNTLQSQEQEISSDNYFNTVLNGNLNLVQVIMSVSPDVKVLKGTQIYELLQNLVQRTLSNDNRILEYQIMAVLNPSKLLIYLEQLIKEIKPTDKYQMKQNYVGIKNLGSTCYMNSILQQFFSIKDFKNIILKHPLKQIPAKSLINGYQIVDDFMYQLQKMYTYLNLSKKKFYYPKEFCLTIKDHNKKPINTSIQQDAHQFLNNLFDKVQTCMKQGDNLEEFQKVFQGKTICEIVCQQCETKKQKIQDFYHLALQVKSSSTLSESFKKFIAPEIIEGYYCQKCEKKADKITKQMFINEAPEILIINLQRIIFDLNTFQKVKVHSRLQFLQTLDISEFTHTDTKTSNKNYKLKGVVIHSGTSEGGHYYSLIKIQNEWYKFNDQSVSLFSFSDLEREAFGGSQSSDGWGDNEFSTNAYILFYEVDKEKTHSQSSRDQIKEKSVMSQKQTIVSQSLPNDDQQSHANINQIKSNEKQHVVDISIQNSNQYIPSIKPSGSIFQWQVNQENKSFYKQIQIHQQSFFDFINMFYQHIRPHKLFENNPPVSYCEDWQTLPYLQTYQKLFSIYMEIMRFFTTFSGVTQKTIHETGTVIYELLTILPETTYNLIHQDINEKIWAEVICTHNDIGIREMYKVALNKILYVYIKYYGWTYDNHSQIQLEQQNQKIIEEKDELNNREQFMIEEENQIQQEQQPLLGQQKQTQQVKKNIHQKERVLQILEHFINTASSDLIAKNIFKSYHFFQFWNINNQMDSGIQNFCLKHNFLTSLLDILMGNEGPLAKKDKKRQDFPYEMAVPIVQTIVRLLTRKKNLVNFIPFKNEFLKQEDYFELTHLEKQVLGSFQFYKKMMKFKYDQGLLSQIIFFMSINDRKFSQKICELFLMGLNKLDEIQDSFALLNNIKSFLQIKDDIQSQRIRWVLGVPQFETVSKLSYGLRYSNESPNIIYVSSRYFIADEKFKPALQVLHDKKNYFTDFQVRGILTLLQILNSSDEAFKYVLRLPPPCYIYYTYLTWVGQYIKRMETQDHFGLSFDKKVLTQNMRNLYDQLLQKKEKLYQQLQQMPSYPVLKKIIGTNKSTEIDEQISNEVFFIRKWTHQTYVLDNLPQQNTKQNLSLPDEIFSIKQGKSYAMYFIENCDVKSCDVQIPTERTVNTLQIQTKKPLKLKFSLPYFDYEIYIQKGQMVVNYPYSEFPLQAYLQVEILENEVFKLPSDVSKDKENNEICQINLDAQMQKHKDSVNAPFADVAGYSEIPGYAEQIGGGYDAGFEIPCETCTFLNDSKNIKCEVCESPLR